ncbi:MAG: hypothetical protein H8D56_04325 [Planctomycetes bacterium]|nr:hypothetical protein [Planctomycetota bacterium]MBL7146420.1 hypothetical protein [Phycisphaerae bacterium]
MVCERDQEPALQTDVTVNGQKIELNNFIQSFMGRAIIGMLSSLRGVGDIQSVNLEISKAPDKGPGQE